MHYPRNQWEVPPGGKVKTIVELKFRMRGG
jgi:hypothetical protein